MLRSGPASPVAAASMTAASAASRAAVSFPKAARVSASLRHIQASPTRSPAARRSSRDRSKDSAARSKRPSERETCPSPACAWASRSRSPVSPVERGALFEHGPRLFGTIQLRERDAQAVQDDALLDSILLTARQEQCGLIVEERRGVILPRPFDNSERVPACEGATVVTECRCQFQGGFEGCDARVGCDHRSGVSLARCLPSRRADLSHRRAGGRVTGRAARPPETRVSIPPARARSLRTSRPPPPPWHLRAVRAVPPPHRDTALPPRACQARGALHRECADECASPCA